MPRTRSPDRVLQIVEAATRIFIRQGYRATSIDEIAAAAGVAPGTVYLYARNKEALFDLVMQRAFGDAKLDDVVLPHALSADGGRGLLETVWQRLQQAAAFPKLEAAVAGRAPRDVAAEFEGIVRELYGWIFHHRRAIKLIERCAQDWPELHALFFRQFRSQGLDRLTRYLTARSGRGRRMRPLPDPATAARGLLELIAWFAMHRFNPADDSGYDDRVAEDTLVWMATGGFLGAAR